MMTWLLAALLFSTSLFGVNTISIEEEQCCNQTERRVVCENCIPETVPSTIIEVVLTNFNESWFVLGIFYKVCWNNATKLVIESDDEPTGLKYSDIPDKTFDCMHQIKSLKLKIPSLNNLSCKLNSFFGLPNVRSLDLTSCGNVETYVLTRGLSLEENNQTLSTIILSILGSFYGGINISQGFTDVLAQRNVSELDMSCCTFKFISAKLNFRRLCHSLRKWNLPYSHIRRSPYFQFNTTCTSLQVVNVTGTHFPRAPPFLGNMSYEPRQANLCFRAFRHYKFQLRMPSHSEGPGIWLSV